MLMLPTGALTLIAICWRNVSWPSWSVPEPVLLRVLRKRGLPPPRPGEPKPPPALLLLPDSGGWSGTGDDGGGLKKPRGESEPADGRGGVDAGQWDDGGGANAGVRVRRPNEVGESGRGTRGGDRMALELPVAKGGRRPAEAAASWAAAAG